MANEEHLAVLKQGVTAWNRWRRGNPHITPDLREADLRGVALKGANLSGANLSGANLSGANLSKANLYEVILYKADLRAAHLDGATLNKADLSGANLNDADLSGADLREANLRGADLRKADLRKADLFQASLEEAALLKTNFEEAILTGCRIYGISAWELALEGATQTDLVITPLHGAEPVITVDDLEVAQFIYLLLHNKKIRQVIETVTSKAVLLLGRFTPKRKAVLDAIREELRRRNYVPILFDFEGPQTRDFTETISILAGMARFIIADLTEPESLPQELQNIVPTLAVPVQPILTGATGPYSMFQSYGKYPWVLPVYRYESLEGPMASLEDQVIAPAEAKVRELTADRRARAEA